MELDPSPVNIAKGVNVLPEHLYLVRNNGEVVGYVEDEAKGILIIGSLATLEMKKAERSSLKILKQEFNGGKEVHVCTQSLGRMWDGRLKKVAMIDIIPVAKIQLSKQ
jgi:hypothetical protein